MPVFELSPDTRLLTDELLKMKPGDDLTHKEMSELLSRNIDGSSAPLLSARRRAEKEDGFVFGTIRGVGVQRLSDTEIVDLGETGAKGIRRAARRTARRVSNVKDFDAMPAEIKARHNGALALFGGIMAAAKASTLRRLEKAANSSGVLSLGRTFELFKGD